MSKEVVTIKAKDKMPDALAILKGNNIHMLPVMDKGKLAGIVTDGDLKKASASDATLLEAKEYKSLLYTIEVQDIMTKDPVTIPPDFTMEEAAEVLLKNQISGVPVVGDDGNIIGTITQTDIFKAMVSLAGLKKRGIKFAFQLEDKSGSIKEVADIIREHGGRMATILTSYDGVKEGFRNVYIRIYGIDRSEVPVLKEEFEKKGTLLYMVDLRENKREIFPQ
jgi:acetoin utilization protein AcuB